MSNLNEIELATANKKSSHRFTFSRSKKEKHPKNNNKKTKDSSPEQSIDDQNRCRICFSPVDKQNPGVKPCLCNALVHYECQQRWLDTTQYKECEICRYQFRYRTQYQWIGCSKGCRSLLENKIFFYIFWILLYLLTPFVWNFKLGFNIYWYLIDEEDLPFQFDSSFGAYLEVSNLVGWALMDISYFIVVVFWLSYVDDFKTGIGQRYKWASLPVIYNFAAHSIGLAIIHLGFIRSGLGQSHPELNSFSYTTWFIGSQALIALAIVVTIFSLIFIGLPYACWKSFKRICYGQRKVIETISAEELAQHQAQSTQIQPNQIQSEDSNDDSLESVDISDSSSDTTETESEIENSETTETDNNETETKSESSSSSYSYSSYSYSSYSSNSLEIQNQSTQEKTCLSCQEKLEPLSTDLQICYCLIPFKHPKCLTDSHYSCPKCAYAYKWHTESYVYDWGKIWNNLVTDVWLMSIFYGFWYVITPAFWYYPLYFNVYPWIHIDQLVSHHGFKIYLLVMNLITYLLLVLVYFFVFIIPPEQFNYSDRGFFKVSRAHLACCLPIIYNFISSILGLIFIHAVLIPTGLFKPDPIFNHLSYTTWFLGNQVILAFFIVGLILIGLPTYIIYMFRDSCYQPTKTLAPSNKV